MPVNNQRQAAKKFVEYWTFQRGSEKGEDQRFWNMLLPDVLGMENVERRIRPQVFVQMKDTTKFLDLWISEAQMLQETAQILHREPDYLPLKDYANIVEGNALRMDWGRLLTADAGRREWHKPDVSSPKSFSYIMGNPPFVGSSMMTAEQIAQTILDAREVLRCIAG